MNTNSYFISVLLLSILALGGILVCYDAEKPARDKDAPLAVTRMEETETVPHKLSERLDAIASAAANPYQRY